MNRKHNEAIIDYFGVEVQLIKFIEELGELQIEISKALMKIGGCKQLNLLPNYEALKEELADVVVLSNQLGYKLGYGDIKEIVDNKIARTINLFGIGIDDNN